MNLFVKAAFNQFVKSAESPETAASIISTAQLLFTRFVSPSVLNAFCGETNLPLDMEGNQLVIFGLDKERRNVAGPLVASIIELLVNRNTTAPRKDPLILSLDEVYTLYLQSLPDWLTQERESGLCTLLGVQHMGLMEETYGRSLSDVIFGNCNTKGLFNPQDDKFAERIRSFLGEEGFEHKQRSRSHQSKGGTSRSLADHAQKRWLVETQQLNNLPTGKCIFINPGHSNNEDANLPWKGFITKLRESDFERQYQDSLLWEQTQHELARANSTPDVAEEELAKRIEAAELLLPLDNDQPSQPVAQGPDWENVLEGLKQL